MVETSNSIFILLINLKIYFASALMFFFTSYLFCSHMYLVGLDMTTLEYTYEKKKKEYSFFKFIGKMWGTESRK
jgi:hypothetical protein